MSLRRLLGKLLIFSVLELGAYMGLRMPPEDIEKLMNAMHRTQVVHVVRKEGE
jgi:hypothetical protein